MEGWGTVSVRDSLDVAMKTFALARRVGVWSADRALRRFSGAASLRVSGCGFYRYSKGSLKTVPRPLCQKANHTSGARRFVYRAPSAYALG